MAREPHHFTAMPVPRYTLDAHAHTSFYVLFCACGHAEIFPRENFALLSPAQRTRFAEHLRVEYGLTLEDDDAPARDVPAELG